ncbi:MAG TPA: hypothetical protein DCE41_25810, partial [Cytophagales bacterium]|nr:hypothetical protein [Cytophagales bacterium]
MKQALFLLGCLALTGCAGSKVVSTVETGDRSNDFKYKNGSTGIRYSVTHDSEYLYLKLLVTERTDMMKMARGGMQVFFDLEGEKNQEVYLQYPLTMQQRRQQRGQGRPEAGQGARPNGRQGQGGGQRLNLSQMLQFLPQEAQFVRFGEADELDMQDPEVDILASIYSPSGEDMVYDLAIPFSRISPNGMAELDGFSVGIRSGKLEMGGRGGNRGGGGGRPGGRPGGGAGV